MPGARADEDPGRDERWLALVAAGGQPGREALWALSAAYNPAFLQHLARKRMGMDDAELVLDRLWERVARRAGGFDRAKSRPGAWLWMLFLGEAADAFAALERDGQRYAQGLLDDGDAVAADARPPGWGTEPELDALLRRCVARAMEALRRKDPDGAELLWMNAAEEWKPEELAEADGRVVGTIKNILSRVRKAARELLKPCHEGRANHAAS